MEREIKTKLANFRITPTRHRRLKKHADSVGESMTSVIEGWIDRFIRPLKP